MSISSFSGEHGFLSNYWFSPVRWDGGVYRTSEHAFQAAKSLDPEVRAFIRGQSTPGDAKREGRRISLRPDWEQVKLGVMYEIVLAKFSQDPGLTAKLLLTGDAELVEGNTWGDRFWGQVGGVGENHLGKILMRVRKELGSAFAG